MSIAMLTFQIAILWNDGEKNFKKDKGRMVYLPPGEEESGNILCHKTSYKETTWKCPQMDSSYLLVLMWGLVWMYNSVPFF